MTITLPRAQQEWLEAQAKAGYDDNIEDAVASIVAEHMHLGTDEMSGRGSLSRKVAHRSSAMAG